MLSTRFRTIQDSIFGNSLATYHFETVEDLTNANGKKDANEVGFVRTALGKKEQHVSDTYSNETPAVHFRKIKKLNFLN